MQKVITDDLEALLNILPQHIRQPLSRQEDISDLLEIVLDLGRFPEARFPQREVLFDQREVSQADIDEIVSRIGSFGDDNRAGIERTLHRISAIRNRMGSIIGLTCRVGRAVFGTIKVIEDLVQTGRSILLLGRPGVGKTTMLREVARVLADDLGKRVIIVDTSNEIAGDGDIPHPAIGRARRMQVKTPTMQHAVMIEAVENHMPQVIVIDEIGTELEAQAARTIAERGVQLVGTAHGNTLENLMMNPTLCDLIGGIQSVTLGDEEAKRRGTQKSVLERKSPPTFDVVVEIQERDRVAIHADVSEAVDETLRGQAAAIEVRSLDGSGEVRVEKHVPTARASKANRVSPPVQKDGQSRLYLFGVNRVRIEQLAHDMGLGMNIVDDLHRASLFVTSKSYYRRKLPKVRDAEAAGIPIYVLRGNTPSQVRQLLDTLNPTRTVPRDNGLHEALGEAEVAVEQVKSGQETVELNPATAYVRRLQHLIAQRHDLASRSLGKEPNRRVTIFRG
jgi:stage III sporulation protein SpoIIIAA